MKCTQCGCNKLIKIDVPFVDHDRYPIRLDIYACYDCGHLEFFNVAPVDYYKRNCVELEEANAELKSVQTHLDILENKYRLKELHDEVNSIRKQLTKTSTPHNQAVELTNRKIELEAQIRSISREMSPLLNKKMDLGDKIKMLNEYFAKTTVIIEE